MNYPTDTSDFFNSFPFGSILNQAEFLLSNTIGIQNGTLYDVLDDNNGTGKVTVGAKSFNATCGSMDATVTGENPIGVPSKNPTGWAVIPKFPGHSDTFFPLNLTAPFVLGNSVAILNSTYTKTSSPRPNMIFYITGPLNITDSYGNVDSRIPIDPPMAIYDYHEMGDSVPTSVSDISIIGCTLSIVNQSAVVDSKTKKLVSAQPNATKVQSEWQTWNPALGSGLDPQLEMWPGIVAAMPPGQVPTINRRCLASVEPCSYIDLGSQYLMEQLGIYPLLANRSVGQGPNKPNPTNITLHQFENALASMTAIIYWAVANNGPDTWLQNLAGMSTANPISILRGSAMVSSVETQLNINIFSLAVGCSTSVILLIVALVLIQRFSGVTKVGVDATGILQTMWMAYRRPQLQDRFLQVMEPTTDNLRTIGMVHVQLVDEKLPLISESTVSSDGEAE